MLKKIKTQIKILSHKGAGDKIAKVPGCVDNTPVSGRVFRPENLSDMGRAATVGQAGQWLAFLAWLL